MHQQGPISTVSATPNRKPNAQSQTPAARPTEPWIPESKLPPLPKDSINSFVRNILLTNPLFPKFYADVVISSAPNSHEAKILAANYQNILDHIHHHKPMAEPIADQTADERTTTGPATNDPPANDPRPATEPEKTMPTSKTCTHIKVTGVRCGSPSLYGEQFCYFHQHAHRGVKTPPQSRLHPMAIIENEESIQASLMEVINALMRNTIDLKRAELILRALHIAVKNARRVKFNAATGMVKEIPDYVGTDAPVRSGPPVSGRETAATAGPDPEPYLPYSAAVPPAPSATEQRRAAKAQAERDHQSAIREKLLQASVFFRRPASSTADQLRRSNGNGDAHVETGALANLPRAESRGPAGPAAPVRSAVETKSEPPTRKPPANVNAENVHHENTTDRNVKHRPLQEQRAAPKERKNLAHGVSRG